MRWRSTRCPSRREELWGQGADHAVEVGGAGAHDYQRIHVRLAVLERPPRASVEAPPSPELHRRGEEKQREVEPPHRDREHKPEHVGQAAEEDERRECGGEQEVALERSVLVLVGVLDRGVLPHHSIACTLDGHLQVSWLHFARQVLDSRPLVGEVHARLEDARHLLESPLNPPHAARARHARHAEGRLAHVRAVARVPYGPDEIIRVRGRGIVGHTRLHSGEVDARLGNTFLFGESPLYSPLAGGAGHPHHRDGDPREPFLLVGRLHAGLPAFTLVRVKVMLYPPTLHVKLTLPLEASCGDRYAYEGFEDSSAPSTHSGERRVAYGLACRGPEIVATAASEDA